MLLTIIATLCLALAGTGYSIYRALMAQYAQQPLEIVRWQRMKLVGQAIAITLMAVPIVTPHLGMAGFFFRRLQ